MSPSCKDGARRLGLTVWVFWLQWRVANGFAMQSGAQVRGEKNMSLIDKLNSELTAAMRSGDQAAKLALRAVKTAIREAEVAGTEARSLSDDEILAVIAKQAKQRRDSIAEFEKGNRPDLVEKEQSELAVLEVYLPQQLEREEIVARARKVIADVGASSTRQMGLVMRPLMEELQGVADGKLVSQVVQQLLRDAPG